MHTTAAMLEAERVSGTVKWFNVQKGTRTGEQDHVPSNAALRERASERDATRRPWGLGCAPHTTPPACARGVFCTLGRGAATLTAVTPP